MQEGSGYLGLTPDQRRNAVEIMLDGQPRYLYFSLNAMAELERVTGWDYLGLEGTPLNLNRSDHLRAILWSELIDDDASLIGDGSEAARQAGLLRVGRWITPDNVFEVRSKVIDAKNKTLPPPEVVDPVVAAVGAEAGDVTGEVTDEGDRPNAGSAGLTSKRSRSSISDSAEPSSGA